VHRDRKGSKAFTVLFYTILVSRDCFTSVLMGGKDGNELPGERVKLGRGIL